jgi:ribosomal-protein-alanine N-acetyltransferase
MRVGDAAIASAIARESPAEGWTRAAFEKEVTSNAGSRYVVVVQGGSVVGFGGIWLVVDVAHVTNMAVAGDHQGRGLGRFVLHGLFDVAVRSHMDELTLEVRVSNTAARRLYTEFGFYETGNRKAYYRDNGEDALIMSTESLATIAVQERLSEIRQRIVRAYPGAKAVIAGDDFETWTKPAG